MKYRNKRLSNYKKEEVPQDNKNRKINRNLNYIALIFVIVIVILGMILKNNGNTAKITPLIGCVMWFTIFIVSFINTKNSTNLNFFIRMGIGSGWTINPKNKLGLCAYIVVFLLILSTLIL